MDDLVVEAMQKWPDVPAVYGWLSLNQSGEWRIHQGGNYAKNPLGEKITNPQILAFIARNYSHTEQGEYFFQNGPQRVFIDLSEAPFVIELNDKQQFYTLNTSETIERIDAWLMDDNGFIYILSNIGFCLVASKDLATIFNNANISCQHSLESSSANNLDAFFESSPLISSSLLNNHNTIDSIHQQATYQLIFANYASAPLILIHQKDKETIGHFIAHPSP
ncbi:hypothetical protein V757_09165 [Pelistega indica]|uniref:DUF2946 domain-containing protein n=1 Tax=Pelistega indica TaxID=1414851 RepID=V8FZQ1_9BURK|nr:MULTISPECIES: DUF2946 family protein [Pelistega]ETD69336.1 hypothetical protein V757_09165 [Pelistega indica]